ncbi:magnesium-translocating P-type ATPase [Humibacter ginsenosidimutans]|uniref:magnesium-translocating P-type ATPase n=1 Tax=Humibacter ginsenosidimutans TaxID=2599293 RepID=UPI00143D1B49|nr:magnesium-translocating P-type ATPase [Humibacter ginsenosidimutans]
MTPPASWWASAADDVLHAVGSGMSGLTSEDAAARLHTQQMATGHRRHTLSWPRLLLAQFTSPILLILVVGTVLSMVLGDLVDGGIIIVILLASGILGFWQEFRANTAVRALMASVRVSVTVVRDGANMSVPVDDVVTGDVVRLAAGNVIPADCRLVSSADLLVDESALTGESFPVEKDATATLAADAALSARSTAVYLGTHVVSGTGVAVAVAAGRDTELGRVSTSLAQKAKPTAFEAGTTRFGGLLVWVMLVLTLFVLIVNWMFGRNWVDSLLFALSLAVGISPQMLPAIVSLSLATGARRMAAKKVVVKRLNAIEDLGAVTVLCTDKTGTLTQGAADLDGHLDLDGDPSDSVLRLAALNAGLQTSFANPLDDAILKVATPPAGAKAIDECPYDFSRKRLSVLADIDGAPTLVSKGALDGLIAVSASARVGGRDVPLQQAVDGIQARFRDLSSHGYRVVGIAMKRMPPSTTHIAAADETGLTLIGLLTFFDPPKQSATDAIADLATLGVGVRMITGDNRLAAASTAAAVGLRTATVLTGSAIDALDDGALASTVAECDVFAEVEPAHKRRIVVALRAAGECVAFLGDGINDSPALHAADVGISVDTAVDVAKEASSVVLMDKGLGVVCDGIRLGRETFANTLKYIRVTTSSNFGNVLSMAAASLFLPFLPMLPRQILLLNFLGDLPSMAISGDHVDPELVERPGTWSLREIRTFMVIFGSLSTVFDLITFAALVWWLHAGEAEFHTGWFVLSAVTEILVMMSQRTRRLLFRSRPSTTLLLLGIAVALIAIVLPSVPIIARPMGFVPLPPVLIVAVVIITIAYIATNEVVKHVYYRWIRPRMAAAPERNSRAASGVVA